jgi:hypothetical protein
VFHYKFYLLARGKVREVVVTSPEDTPAQFYFDHEGFPFTLFKSHSSRAISGRLVVQLIYN